MKTNSRSQHLRAVLVGWALALVSHASLDQSLQAVTQENSSRRREVRVEAASDLKFAMDEVVQEFQKDHPETAVKVTYGSSGNFYSQLSNQAPFDLFLSADIGYPRKLSEQGLTLPGTEFLYAIGSIVLWVP